LNPGSVVRIDGLVTFIDGSLRVGRPGFSGIPSVTWRTLLAHRDFGLHRIEAPMLRPAYLWLIRNRETGGECGPYDLYNYLNTKKNVLADDESKDTAIDICRALAR
jgi:hypothetical protein